MSSSSSSHGLSRSDAPTSRSTSSYGQVIERSHPPSVVSGLVEEEPNEPPSPQSPRTDALDSLRDQVAQTIVLRAVRKAETIDGTQVGVVTTLPHSSGELFLKTIASRLKRAMLPKQESYLFILTLPTQGLSPVLVCSSSEDLAERAGLLLQSKFLNRVERHELRHGRWGALIRDLCTTTYDEAALWDAVRKAARHPIDPLVPPPGSRSIAQILAHARARLERITPQVAYEELQDSTAPWPVVLVDIRPRRSGGRTAASRARSSSSGTCWSGGSTRAARTGCPSRTGTICG
ncbi:hypothetical protein C8T65DRAFT_280076 [Cerioporus squamosus]|nr:hypothetical protein C8T65DRAFT_280076 [Cerioporus squamosus]